MRSNGHRQTWWIYVEALRSHHSRCQRDISFIEHNTCVRDIRLFGVDWKLDVAEVEEVAKLARLEKRVIA